MLLDEEDPDDEYIDLVACSDMGHSVGDIVDLASNIDIINKSGAWYAYEGNKIGQGRENTKIYLEEHPDICQEIEDKVRAYYDFEKNGEENEDN